MRQTIKGDGMKRVGFMMGVVLLAGVLAPAAPGASTPACEAPEPSITYDDYFTATLTVDYRGCGRPPKDGIWIEGGVWRGGPFDGHGSYDMKFCGGGRDEFVAIAGGSLDHPATSETEKSKRSKKKNKKAKTPKTCTLSVKVPSRSVDVLTKYEGGFYYQWQGAEAWAPFRFRCTSVPSRECIDW